MLDVFHQYQAMNPIHELLDVYVLMHLQHFENPSTL